MDGELKCIHAVGMAVTVECAELCELRFCYPRGLFNVLGCIDLQVLKYGLVSILNHKFIIGALLPRQAHFTLR